MRKLKTGITSGMFGSSNEVEKYFSQINKYGYDSVDIDCCSTLVKPYTLSGKELEDYIESVKTASKKYNVSVSQIHGPWRYPPKDGTDEDKKERLEKMEASIRFCAAIGCKYWVIHTIYPFGPAENKAKDGLLRDEMYRQNVEFFKKLVPVAEECGVYICLENLPFLGSNITTVDDTLELIKKIDSENVKMCLDTGHCFMSGLEPSEAVRRIGKDLLAVLHVHDNYGDRDSHMIPFIGKTNWTDFKAALKEIGFCGVISIECDYNKGMAHMSPELFDIYNKALAFATKELANI